MPGSETVRDHLVAALEADLIGPFDPNTGKEVLRLAPSRWYLAGYLAPEEGRAEEDPTDGEELAVGDDEDEPESPAKEPEPKRRGRMPASIGMSVLLPREARSILTVVSWADYELLPPEEREEGDAEGRVPTKASSPAARNRWERQARGPFSQELPLDPEKLAAGFEVPGSGGVRLVGQLDEARSPGLEDGARALSLFLVNRREPAASGQQDSRYLFQVRLEVRHPAGLVARPNLRGESSDQWDDRVAELQFRNRAEYAVGHGVSVETVSDGGRVTGARTTYLPRVRVTRVEPRDLPEVETSMELLAALPDGDAVRKVLGALPERYGAWIAEQRAVDVGRPERAKTQATLMSQAEDARKRIVAGLDLLASDPQALDAFRLANRAMALSARQRSPERYGEGKVPRWRLFQLAFVLLNLPGLVSPEDKHRGTVELIFFPTGGGKTEAYLGVIAFALVLRRLRRVGTADEGLGVAVLLRYTLRLLTLDQLGRAATLMCALERLRHEDARLGSARFSIGLWVGKSATANTLKEVTERITQYKNNTSEGASSPFPLTTCPWCQAPLGKTSLNVRPSTRKPEEVVVGCSGLECPFSTGRSREGLPVLFVDEQIYRELPSFLVATVDKFALLPWRGEAGMLFGLATARDGHKFYGPMDGTPPALAKPLLELLPPELIVQDELHLISGPLGTMVGLFESAVEGLCSRPASPGGARRLPKILASTATVRRAQEQVRALFARRAIALFPPPGIDESETFFATRAAGGGERLYVGVAAPKPLRATLLRAYVALLGAGEHEWDPRDKEPAADPYMTLAGYFNSLRELGGMRRLVEDEVRSRLLRVEQRTPGDHEGAHPWFRDRTIQTHPVELTSRERTAVIAETKANLGRPHNEKGHIDVVLATNMISVGVDIERLGLMVIAGQPKTTSEYIQASSRVGRDSKRPGLVITVFGTAKPRDRSHYERFVAYHECFYRFVEAGSVTPYSGPALDRGLAAVLVALTRFSSAAMTAPEAAMEIGFHRGEAEAALAQLAARAELSSTDGKLKSRLVARGRNLLDAWEVVMKTNPDESKVDRRYSPWERGTKSKALLFDALDSQPRSDEELKFVAPTSMRDVEPSVHFWVSRFGAKKKRTQ